jgi:hypothetical protein
MFNDAGMRPIVNTSLQKIGHGQSGIFLEIKQHDDAEQRPNNCLDCGYVSAGVAL